MKAKPASRRSGRGAAKTAAPSKTTAAKRPAKVALIDRTEQTEPTEKAVPANKVKKKPAPRKGAAKAGAPSKTTVAKRPAKVALIDRTEPTETTEKAVPAKKAKKKPAPRETAAVKPAPVRKSEAEPAGTAKETLTQGRILVVSGSDSSGGAGVQADIKTITALGGYALTALTALTAQNTEGVNGVIETPAGFIAKQIRLVLKDIGADVIKIGIVPNADAVEAVHYTYMEMAEGVPIVLDPVMLTDGGEPLADREAIHLVRQHFLLHAQIVTPNIPEAEILAGMEIRSLDDMKHAAEIMITLGSQAVLLKGGKFTGEKVYDVLYDENGIEVFETKRIKTMHTHGAGCTLSSAIAVSLAQKYSLRDAVVRARDYVHTAISTAPGFGKGHGPLNHAHTVKAPSGEK